MNFDTFFNYNTTITGLTSELNDINNAMSMFTNELANLQMANAYANEPIVIDKITELQINIAELTNRKNTINDVLAEIANINALPAESKTSLLYFYSIVNPTKQEYMAKMLFNYQAALADTRITTLIADSTTPAVAKNAVAQLIYDSYSINAEKKDYIMAVYRYPN